MAPGKLPSRQQCLKLLEKYGLPGHIVRHCLAVEKVAVFLAEKLREAGEQIDVDLVSRAALLHDIDKAETLKPGFGHLHGQMGKEILEKEGFPELGQLALRHLMFRNFEENPFDSWEEKVLNYADKRVNHDKIVSLDERFEYLLKRYGKSKESFGKISACRPFLEGLEKEIFSKISADKNLEGI